MNKFFASLVLFAMPTLAPAHPNTNIFLGTYNSVCHQLNSKSEPAAWNWQIRISHSGSDGTENRDSVFVDASSPYYNHLWLVTFANVQKEPVVVFSQGEEDGMQNCTEIVSRSSLVGQVLNGTVDTLVFNNAETCEAGSVRHLQPVLHSHWEAQINADVKPALFHLNHVGYDPIQDPDEDYTCELVKK